MLNGTETVRMSDGDSVSTYLGAGDAKCGVDEWPIFHQLGELARSDATS